jgi:hypothetical protein
MRDAAALVRELPNFLLVHMDPVCEPDVVCEPVDGFHPVHRPQLETFERIMFLIERFAQMSVEHYL